MRNPLRREGRKPSKGVGQEHQAGRPWEFSRRPGSLSVKSRYPRQIRDAYLFWLPPLLFGP